eukprot:CAMPEP_0201521372 /NCGR_PEP_ID=MMETSP0161_2-20130828/14384_1 /ASSEMBLY_ACC=CAM_ASM_000251 /TAXON_ID=180227 /ORGANISM="Neoparamoeba aestuarina, Strain SoJaBio B1-5/56/2" /LENGTH=259 /DNA_ID=CAMNT_0047920001 /DNA_START=70 /DNA_END=846 /DNA_ORIENTATION=+
MAFKPLLLCLCLCASSLFALTSKSVVSREERSHPSSSLGLFSLSSSEALFTIQWDTNVPKGYREATFDDFASEDFSNFYNQNQGLPYNTTQDPGGICGLSVKEGYLKFPSNSTEKATDVSFANDNGRVSCLADEQTGTNGLIATMATEGCGDYQGNIFSTPVTKEFFSKNFFTKESTCEFDEGEDSYVLYIRDTPASPSPTPTPVPPPSSAFSCCGYFNFDESFETFFCQYPGQRCSEIPGFVSVGNNTVGRCDECGCQ